MYEGQNQRNEIIAEEYATRSCLSAGSTAASPAADPAALTLEMARVIAAITKGDLSQSLGQGTTGRPVQTELVQLQDAIIAMLEQLRGVTSEVARVTREAGTEGKPSVRAELPGVSGVWRDLTDNVNGMASILTAHLRGMAELTTAEHLY